MYKRCICPVQRDAAGKKLTCLKAHGNWSFVANLPAEGPHPRRQHTKGGFPTKRDAEAALRTFLATVDRGQVVLPTKVSFDQYIDSWLEAVEPSLSATTVSNHRIIVRCYLRSHLRAYTASPTARRAVHSYTEVHGAESCDCCTPSGASASRRRCYLACRPTAPHTNNRCASRTDGNARDAGSASFSRPTWPG